MAPLPLGSYAYQSPIQSPGINQPVGPFSFCRVFDGSEPASRWLKRLEYELQGSKRDGIIPPEQYLSSVDLLLVGEAADWAESSYEISTILAGSHTKHSLDRFLSLFRERFPTKSLEPVTTFSEEVEGLRQGVDESLNSYYQRTTNILSRFGARDRPSEVSEGSQLSMLESSMLGIVRSAFLKGLFIPELRYEAIRGAMSGDGASLRGTFMATKQAYEARLMIKEIEDEQYRSRETAFYKEVVTRNVDAAQLESMKSRYRAGEDVPEQAKLPDKLQLPAPSSQKPLTIESKSVTWSDNPASWSTNPWASRSILKPGSSYSSGAVVSSGSVTAGVDQGVG